MSDSLTFRLLKYIKESAETLNFTRAAERVFVAQSSLSHQIGKFEDNIELTLFERTQNGLRLTPAGRLIAAYADNTLKGWDETLVMAHAVQRRQVPPLRLGFSAFVDARVMEKFHENYKGMFDGCAIQLISGDSVFCLQHLDAGLLDCAILPLPIDANLYSVQPISQTPLVVCMRTDDVLAERAQLDIREIAARITVFRDPEQYPSAHARLVEMFTEAGVTLHVACFARTPAEIRNRDDGRCRTGEGGVMQTIVQIIQKAGGWHPGLYLKIDNAPYMELVIEAMDESGPMELPAISVAHYGEQNGDLMRDPEMCFELGMAGGPHLSAFYYRNDYLGVEQWSRNIVRGNYVHLIALHEQHQRFAKTWDNNLRLQGFADAFTEKCICG
jgi:DNA-binding transcriptional LysR family regulator